MGAAGMPGRGGDAQHTIGRAPGGADHRVASGDRVCDRDGAMIDRNDTAEILVEWPGAWRIRTRSGSVYTVAHDRDGKWWLGGRNVANPFSTALPPGLWEIEPPQPWPPIIGLPLIMLAPTLWATDNPKRIPGGGKVTSPVEAFELIKPDPDQGDDEDDLPWSSGAL